MNLTESVFKSNLTEFVADRLGMREPWTQSCQLFVKDYLSKAKTSLNYTALHMAIQSGDIAIVTLLLSKNPDLGKYRMCKL